MFMYHKGLYLLTLVIWFIIKSQSKSTTFCGTRTPVIKICTTDTLNNQTSVNIDSSSVPYLQNSSCKCTISPSNSVAEFIFTLKETVTNENILFEINDIVFDDNTKEEDRTRTTRLFDETDLTFSTSGTARIALCLIVSSENEVKFDITCLAVTLYTTTTERPLSSASTVEETSTLPSASTAEDASASSSASTVEDTSSKEEQVLPEDKNEQNKTFLVPVLAASAGVVCIAGVAVVIVICRRRSISEKPDSDTSTTVAEKQNDDDYYMTENPMYDATEILQNILPNSESEYHYIEHDNHGGCDESIPGTLVGKQISPNHGKPDLHYDYTTCISAVGRKNTQAKKKTREKSAGNKKEGVSLANKPIVDDQVYDRTDSGKAKQFVSVNEYHHLSSVASRKKRVPETYNTVENVKNDHKDQDYKLEEVDYHITNVR